MSRHLLLHGLARRHLLLHEPPHDAEEQALYAVGEVARAQAAPEQARHAVLGQHLLGGGDVGDAVRVRLLRSLDDADGVGARVGDDGGAEAHERVAKQLLRCHVSDEGAELGGGREGGLEGVVRVKPREVPHHGRAGGGEGAGPEDLRSAGEHLGAQLSDGVLALHLHRRLEAVDGHEEDAEQAGRCRRRRGLDGHRKIPSQLVAIQQC
eukprot:CAMPEP_0172171922 /NCGR_PEP_ID=MMETSP1050-20130122/12161_1 /TAXON_ID=233186 /ORGANISM="Cryptomonas curvata, Strain CCAP979/52" /LENGTH=208 /DNA_ID=CAMNT_0012843407 /DNA_START=331 /DNA_END=957 /DNA_ORIENTATION=-